MLCGARYGTKAVTYCQQAGTRAYDRAAFREAVASFEQALQTLEHLREHSDTRVLAIELRLAVGARWPHWEHWAAPALLGEAEALARALDDRAWLGQVLASMASVLRVMGDPTVPLQQAGRPSRSWPNLATAPCRCMHPIPWGRHTMSSATSAGR